MSQKVTSARPDGCTWRRYTVLLAAVLASACSDNAPDASTQELADRMMIGDLITDLYADVEAASGSNYSTYYTPDAVFEVNGTRLEGREEIIDYHREVARTSPKLSGTFHMLVDNLRIEVLDDTAKASLIFTGVLSESLTRDPRLHKHGREYDLLQRQDDGEWKIIKRVIVSDASAESDFVGIERPGPGYDILDDR